MNRDVRMTFAVFFIMAGLFTGMNYMVTKEKDSGMLGLAIAFLILAVLFWLWLRQQTAEDDSIEETAQRAIKEAETKAAALQDAVKSQLERETTRAVPIETEASEEPSTPTETPAAPEPEKVIEPPAPIVHVEPVPAAEADLPVANIEPEKVPAAPIVHTETEKSPEPEPTEPGIPGVADVAGDDDLQRIEGIGPKYRDILVQAGVKTFAQIAAMTENELVEMIRAGGGRKSASMSTWAEQAKLAANGDWEALAALQANLSGGRREE